MVEHQNIYINETEQYHALVSFEDYKQNLTSALKQIIGKGSPAILESGAGTGRITEILAPLAGNLIGFDISPSMLGTANLKINQYPKSFLGFSVSDHRWLPVNSEKFNWIISGWSVCYLVSLQKESWKKEVNRALCEFLRVLDPRGSILLIETLGTGKIEPDPPIHLMDYLEYLSSLGFDRQVIRTDYCFPDRQTSENLVEFFFGKEMLSKITEESQPVLPECTGLFSITYQDLINRFPG
jgi:ubiquinone/menaquinone biosynthesis C-methylase UbiE